MSEKSIQEIADEHVAQHMKDYEESKRTPPETPEQQLAALRFREEMRVHALLHDVAPAAVRHVLADAAEVFTLNEDGALVPKHGQTDPGDPLSPLTPARWLERLAQTDGYLFTT